VRSISEPETRNRVKKIALAALLLFSLLAWAGSNTNPADYTVNVHVSRSRIVGDHLGSYQKLNVVIDGRKYELLSDGLPNTLLAIGNYKAKLVKDEHRVKYDSYQVYEFLFPDQRTRKFIVVGQTE
jgi:hypothetical protein